MQHLDAAVRRNPEHVVVVLDNVGNNLVGERRDVREMVIPEGIESAVEYGLIVALIAAVIIGIVATLGTKVNSNFSKVSNNLP